VERFACNDSSGLSYDNRATSRGMLRLLWFAAARPWGLDLRSTLAKPGVGTLRDRLDGVTLRAKTGTLEDVSALSGWVRSDVDGTWIAFSILSSHFDYDMAKTIEDRIVRVIASSATDPTP
jgi:serine-type D-Ala-D-Ala carboxypeptidase/endopeptidase (penicillin-binding protein 4)